MPVIPSHDPVPGSYSVKWASVNHKDEPNVLTITPGFGDGSEERWPPQGPDMSLLGPEHEKQQQWRRTAAEVIAKDLGLLKRALPLPRSAADDGVFLLTKITSG